MFELRILRKRTDKVQPSGKYYIDVLQFKERDGPGDEYNFWSEWKDVPIVEEITL